MPLITKLLPSRDTQDFHRTVKVQQASASAREQKDKDSGYDDFEEYNDDEGMESEMEDLHRPRQAKSPKAPALPQRSEKRASRMLDNVRIELKVLDGMKPKEGDRISMVQESDPHELYLSSEEDASLSDDYEDSFLDFDGEDMDEGSEPTKTTSRRKSQEDTARVVSLVLAKPQIVNILHSNHASPVSPENRHSVAFEKLPSLQPSVSRQSIQSTQSTASQPKSTRRPSPLKLYPSSLRRLSVSSMAAPTQTPSTLSQYSAPIHQNSSLTNLPSSLTPQQPRKSSRLGITTNLSSLASSARSSISHASHSFLSSDPFAQSAMVPEENEPGEPPKTPNSLANWKRGFSRTLSKAARKPSMPKISLAYTAGVVPPRPSTSAATPTSRTISMTLPPNEYGIKRSETEPITPTTAAPPPTRYEEMMRNAAKAPTTTSRENKKMSFGGLGRRKSVKGRDGRYI